MVAIAARAIGLGAVVLLLVAAQAYAGQGLARVHWAKSGGIRHRYVVVLRGRLPSKPTRGSERAARAKARRVASSVGAKPLFLYDADIRGFAADLTRSQLDRLRHDPRVKYIDQDERVHDTATLTQVDPSWGLDRIDQRSLPGDSAYHYPATAGEGVTAYILDTGIIANHSDFGGRGSFAVNTVDRTRTDGNGHGTHVAGIVGGTRYGVAKLVKLVGVKVLNDSGSGTAAGVIEGMDWVAEHATADVSVANLSLGGGKSQAINDAATRMVGEGVFVVAAAGNDNKDACNSSPASAPAAFTIAATDSADSKATFSNFGACVDAYAPGRDITSDWIGSTNAIRTISGTSMAAPFAAGVAALYLAEHPGPPATVTKWLIDQSTRDVVVKNVAGTPNRLLFAGGF